MNKATRATIIAIGVFGLLLAVVLATRERTVSVGVKKIDLSTIDKGKVVGMEFSGAKSAVLRKEPGGWFVYDPTQANAKHPADEQTVNSALDALAATQVADLVTERADKYPEYDLDDAKRLNVRIMQEGKSPVAFALGKAAKSGGTYVVESGKGPVFVAQGQFGWVARKDAKAWRKRSIASIKSDEIAAVLSRDKNGESITLKPGANGGWELAESVPPAPPGFRFDPQSAQRMVQGLASISAQDYADPGTATEEQLGLAGSHDLVEVTLKDGKKVVLHLGQEVDPASFAPKTVQDAGTVTPPRPNKLVPLKVEGDAQVYLVASFSANQMKKRLEDLRDLSLMSFDPQKVSRLVVQAGKKVVAKKESGAWKVVEPKTLPAGLDFDPQQVVVQLNRLKSLKATRLVSGNTPEREAGLAKPSGTVEVTLDDGKKELLRFGKETADGAAKEMYVKGAVDSQLYVIGKDAFTRLGSGVELFKKPPPPPDFGRQGGGMRGLESLPPDVRQKIEAQLRQQGRQ